MGPLKQFLRNDDGSVAIEYVLIGSLVSIALIAQLPLIAHELNAIFTAVMNALGTS